MQSSSQQTDSIRTISESFYGAGGGGCFVAGTLVSTPDGNIPIEDIKVGQQVYSFRPDGALECKSVLHTHTHEEMHTVHYMFWGVEVTATPNHWVLNQYNRFVPIGSLTEEDGVPDFRDHLCPLLSSEPAGMQKVYNLTVEGWHTYIANGLRVHNGGGSKGGGGSTTRVAQESPNTLRSKAQAKVIDLLCEGPIRGLSNGGQSIFLDDTPLYGDDGVANFSGVGYEIRTGEPDQTALTTFKDVQNEIPVGTTVDKSLGRVIRTVSNLAADKARLKIQVPRFTEQDTTNGDLFGSSVEFEIAVRPTGGSWTTVDFGYSWSENPVEDGVTDTGVDIMEVTVQADVSGTNSQKVSAPLQIQYRPVSGGSWTTTSAVTVEKVLLAADSVSTINASTSGTIVTGTVSHTFIIDPLPADQYEVQVVQGDRLTRIRSRQKSLTRIVGKSVSPVEFGYEIPLDGDGPWDISVTRITEDADSSAVQNSFVWTSYTEVVDQKFIYPDSALVGMTVDAELFGDSIPSRMYEIDGLIVQVPSNYDTDTRTYTGIWDGTFTQSWTNNPAWCLLDLLTSTRYGAGIPIESIDTAALYTIAKYCDELIPDGLGGTEPRFTLNCYIQTREQAYNVINTLVSVFRGMIYWAAGAVAVIQDSPRDVDLLVGRANAINGEFSYSGASKRSRHNTAIVTWHDPAQLYKGIPEVVELNDDILKDGRKETDVYAFGCTSRGQANRLGKWILFTEWKETEMVTYSASFDHGEVAPGMIIGIIDPTRAAVDYAGRMLSTSGTSITLDRDITLEVGETYQLAVVDSTGAIQYRTLSDTGTGSTWDIGTALDPAPVDGAMWSVFGSDVEPTQYRVLAVREQEPNIYEITGLEYVRDKFDLIEQDEPLEPIAYSKIPTGAITPPTDLDLEETLFKTNNMVRTRAIVSWTPSTDVRVYQYEVTYRTQNGQPKKVLTSESSYEFLDLEIGTYDFEVRAIGGGKVSVPLVGTYDVLGKTAPPADVTNFTADRRVAGVQLTWDKVTDLDLIGYEIREGNSFEDYNTKIVEKFVGTTLFVQIDDALPRTYHIKAIDDSDVYSDSPATLTASVIAPECPPAFEAIPQQDHVLFRLTPVSGLGVEYEIRQGASWEVGVNVVTTSSNEVLVLEPTDQDRTYWIKALSQAGLYSAVSRGTTTTRALWTDRNILIDYDNQIDNGSGRWEGYTHRMVIGTDYFLFLDEDSSSNTYTRGEQFFYTELSSTDTARNWMETSLVNVSANLPTWADATYTWQSPQAQSPWLPTGNTDGASLSRYIAWEYSTLPTEYLYGFGLSADTHDFRGVLTADAETNASYAAARYGNGLVVDDTVFVSWTVSVPATFSMKFNFHLTTDDIETGVVFITLKNSSSSDWLEIGYNKTKDQFYARDSDGNDQYVTVDVEPEDFLTIGIAQTATQRRLFVKSAWSNQSQMGEMNYAGLGTFDKLYLYEA